MSLLKSLQMFTTLSGNHDSRNTATIAISILLVRRFLSLSASSFLLFFDPGFDLKQLLFK